MHHTNSEELTNLANFLNLRLTQNFDVVSGPTDRAIKFMRTYGDFIRTNGDPLPELVETQREIAFFLKAALQPEVLVKSYPRRRKFKRRGKVPIDDFSTNFKAQNAQMVANFKADPGHFLHPLIERINEAERRAQWIAEESPPATAWNLSIRDKRWSLKRNPYGGPGTVLHWLARVLEQNELSKLGCCHVCRRFFVLERHWQVYCGEKCRTKYSNYTSAFRKADNRATKKRAEAAKRLAKQRQESKDKLLSKLKSLAFLNRLPGGPNQKHTRQAQLITLFESAKTVEAFRANCDPNLQRLLDAVIEE